MMMARANCRAVSATTEAITAPSRKCTCQSSGRIIVSVSVAVCIRPLVQSDGVCHRHAALYQPAEHGATHGYDCVIEIEGCIMQHAAVLGSALAQAKVSAWSLLQHEREVFRAHRGRKVGHHPLGT